MWLWTAEQKWGDSQHEVPNPQSECFWMWFFCGEEEDSIDMDTSLWWKEYGLVPSETDTQTTLWEIWCGRSHNSSKYNWLVVISSAERYRWNCLKFPIATLSTVTLIGIEALSWKIWVAAEVIFFPFLKKWSGQEPRKETWWLRGKKWLPN